MPPPDPVVAVPVGIESRYRKTGQRPATATWKDQQDLEEDSAYVSSGNSNDYADTAGSSSSADADYDLASRDYRLVVVAPSRIN